MMIKKAFAFMLSCMMLVSSAWAAEYLTYAQLKEELRHGWHETIGSVTIDLTFDLPDTDTLTVIAVSPRPAFDDALMDRYIPHAQENICNEPGHIFQFYNGPLDNRKSYVLSTAFLGCENFGTHKPETAFLNGITFDLLESNLNFELQYLSGAGLNSRDWQLSYEVSHYGQVDSLLLFAHQVFRGLITPYQSMLCMQTWDRDYYYFWIDLYQEDRVVMEDLSLSSLEPIKETLRQSVLEGTLASVDEIQLIYEPFRQENGEIWLIPLWYVKAQTAFHGFTPAFNYYYSVQTGQALHLQGVWDTGYAMAEPLLAPEDDTP